jgi:hypothetical protein
MHGQPRPPLPSRPVRDALRRLARADRPMTSAELRLSRDQAYRAARNGLIRPPQEGPVTAPRRGRVGAPAKLYELTDRGREASE